VQGIVLMRRGEQSSPTIARGRSNWWRRSTIPGILPPGIRIERIYDRKDLIDITTRDRASQHGARHPPDRVVAMDFPGGFCAGALIVGATIPFALFFAVIILVLRGGIRQFALGRRAD